MSGDNAIGLIGLGVMGGNLARNIARHGFPVAVHDYRAGRAEEYFSEHRSEGGFTAARSLADLAQALTRPRQVIVMVTAGPAVDAVIDDLVPVLDDGDVVIDAGNSHFLDTKRRTLSCEKLGIRFLGTGVSGGAEGALFGPSIMPGGDPEGYAIAAEILTTIAAQVDGEPCCAYVGPDGAGHYVKMVHNGIEYADIQLIAEAYDVLRHRGGLSVAELSHIFDEWNRGDLESYLIESTAKVLAAYDADADLPLIDVIVDAAEQKGTGRWTSQDALELGVPLTAITEAVFARSLSGLRRERLAASEVLAGPEASAARKSAESLVDDVERALYASKIVAYAQGFEQLASASAAYGWSLDLGSLATIWRDGCIIRARFLDRIRKAYAQHDDAKPLLTVPYFRDALASSQTPWRRVVADSVDAGLPIPAFASSLTYYDGYRRARGPANLIQGLRDYFGAHTYHRTDQEGTFHTAWAKQERDAKRTTT